MALTFIKRERIVAWEVPIEVSKKETFPLVSALMISSPRAARYSWFLRSLTCFAEQSHREKELVVVLNRINEVELRRARKAIRNMDLPRLRLEVVPGEPSLGQLRNLSRSLATGEFHAQWDDDDLSHRHRIREQLRGLKDRYEACYLREGYQYFAANQAFYRVNHHRHKGSSQFPAGLPQTLMVSSALNLKYPDTGPGSQKNEDVYFYQSMREAGYPIGYVESARPLYVYVSHGANVFDPLHHFAVARHHSVSDRRLKSDQINIIRDLKYFGLADEKIRVFGKAGLIVEHSS